MHVFNITHDKNKGRPPVVKFLEFKNSTRYECNWIMLIAPTSQQLLLNELTKGKKKKKKELVTNPCQYGNNIKTDDKAGEYDC